MNYEPGEETIRDSIANAFRLRWQCRLDEAATVLRRMMARSGVAPLDRAAMLKELAEVELTRGGWSEANQHLDEALKLVSRDASAAAQHIRAGAEERKASALFRLGDIARAKQTAEAALTRMPDDTNVEVTAGLYNTLGGIAWQQGHQTEAITLTSRAADLYEQFGDDAGAATARTNMGILLFTAGRWDEAEEQFAQADEMRKTIGWDSERPRGLINLAILEIARGKRNEARRDLSEAVQLSTDLGQRYIRARAELAFAELELLDGHPDEAGKHLDAAANSSCLCEDDHLQAARLKALIECDRGGSQRAIELAEKARARAREAGLVESEADCCRALGVAYRRSKRHDQAEKTLNDAVALAERTGNPYRRALALLELGEACHASAASDRARKSIGEASDVFRSLGATADLARADALRQSLA